MKKLLIILTLVTLAFALPLVVGCGEKTETADEAATEAVDEAVTEAAAEAEVATADCAGSCGMKNVPKDQMTEKDGKFYCAGCAHALEDHDHSGHDHG